MTRHVPGLKASRTPARGFTLIELLVVVAVIAILASLLLPSLAAASHKGRQVVCLSNLRQIGIAIQTYAADNAGLIPYGPIAPPFTSPTEFYPSTGSPTSLISLRSGARVGLGLLLDQHLANTPRVLFCPGSDQPLDAGSELAKVGSLQSQASYYYRHAGVTELFAAPTNAPERLRLDALGDNRMGNPIRALVIDSMFLCGPDLATFNVKPRTHHRLRSAGILFADGHVSQRANRDHRFTVDLRDYSELRDAFNRILGVLERADLEP